MLLEAEFGMRVDVAPQGDFTDGVNLFKEGQTVDPGTFSEKWVRGLVEWWNIELKDRTAAGPMVDLPTPRRESI